MDEVRQQRVACFKYNAGCQGDIDVFTVKDSFWVEISV